MTAGVVTIVTSHPAEQQTSGDIVVTGGVRLEGWMDVGITLRAEGFPNDWNLTASSSSPIEGKELKVNEGDYCRVLIDDDVVITGYVDRVSSTGDRQDHRLSLMGRGKTQDLVDCSAEWAAGGQIMSATALEIASELAQPYGIDVELGEGAEAGPQVPQFNLTYGETPADIIQRVTRNAGLLAYRSAEGRLVLARTGGTTASSGIVYRKNVEAYSVTRAMDQRMSEIVCAYQGQDVLGDLGDGGFFFDTQPDPGVRRHRRLYLVMEASALGPELTKMKAKWEVARRAGRGIAVEVTVDSWRDSAGRLWLPNTLVPVVLPGLAAPMTLCIAEASFRRTSEEGTVARLYLLPPGAFAPEPISLAPVNLNDLEPTPA